MKAAVRERPILLGERWVRAILDGRKTQTRRPMNPQPVRQGILWSLPRFSSSGERDFGELAARFGFCRHGYIGDRLWVRECYLPMKIYDRGTGVLANTIDEASYVCFRDGSQKFRDGKYFPWISARPPDPHRWPENARWRPSMHMPRWASRITLEITGARGERLQDMTEDDARAEGVADRTEFAAAWDATYPDAGMWDWNPWVWAIEFRVAEGGLVKGGSEGLDSDAPSRRSVSKAMRPEGSEGRRKHGRG